MASRRNDDGLSAKIVAAYKAGMSGPKIGAKYKITVSTVYYYLRVLNVKRRARSVAKVVSKGRTGRKGKTATKRAA